MCVFRSSSCLSEHAWPCSPSHQLLKSSRTLASASVVRSGLARSVSTAARGREMKWSNREGESITDLAFPNLSRRVLSVAAMTAEKVAVVVSPSGRE